MLADESVYKNIVDNMIPLHKLLGIKLLAIDDGYAKLHVPFKPELVGDPRSQVLHGGVISTAMDSAGGAVGMTTLVSEQDVIQTIDIRVDYLQPARSNDLIVEGKIARSGVRILVTSMVAYDKEGESAIAEGKGVYNVRRKTEGEQKQPNQEG